MIGFEVYEKHLSALLRQLAVDRLAPASLGISSALDGQPGRVLRLVTEPEALDQAGAFFTSQRFADKLVSPWEAQLKKGDLRIFDSACGAGDLLLAAARLLPTEPTLSRTLKKWGQVLHGCDLHPTFVRTTKVRLALLAASRCKVRDGLPKRLFPGIECGDFLKGRWLDGMTHVIMNPPFTIAPAPISCRWADGVVNQAGVFFKKGVDAAPNGARIAAILPDVLRTGSRYRKWRKAVEDGAVVDSLKSLGRFSTFADVDVFLLHVQIRKSAAPQRTATPWWKETGRFPIGAAFDVNVGPVVPFRDPRRGPRTPFFEAGCAPLWKVIRTPTSWRRYAGRLHTPPFVVVRRTSSPGDKFRAAASVIALKEPIAVENHLLVLTPKDGTLKACRQLMASLKDARVSEWLNKRIRCRHLTVDAVAKIPFYAGTQS